MASIIATNYSRHMLYVLSICMHTTCVCVLHLCTYVHTYIHTYVHTCYRHTLPCIECDLL